MESNPNDKETRIVRFDVKTRKKTLTKYLPVKLLRRTVTYAAMTREV